MKTLKLLGAALAAVTMAFTAQAEKTAKAVVAPGGKTLKFVYDEMNYGTKGTDWFSVADAEAKEPGYTPPWYAKCDFVTNAVFDASFADYRPKHCSCWFYGFYKLKEISGIENLNTSEATSLAYMFGFCELLKSLDLSSFDTARATNMDGMFVGCTSLMTICASDGFSTARVTASSDMFYDCTSLKGGRGTACNGIGNVNKDYARIDGGPSAPGYFSISAKVFVEDDGNTLRFTYDATRPSGVRGKDWFLVEGDGPVYDEDDHGWYFPRWRDVYPTVVFDPSFADYRPKNCVCWFDGNSDLTTVEGLENLNVSEATSLSLMFVGCRSLKTLDLSGFDTANVTLMNRMFDGCTSLETIYASDKFVTARGLASFRMFGDCTALKGGAGTAYVSTKTDATYARIDGEGGLPGYFTRGKTASAADDLNGDGRADIVMTIDKKDHLADGSTGAWLIQSNQTAAWGDLSQRNADWDILGLGATAPGKATKDVYLVSSENVVGAWTTDASGKVGGWKTIDSFNSATTVGGLGDFNGDGQSDLLLVNRNGAVGCYFTSGKKTGWNYFQSLGPEWQICGIGDLNGDGRDDLVLLHDEGFAGSWLTQADGTMEWAGLDTLQPGFAIVGCGDFDGDGTDDVLLRKDNYYGAWLVRNGNAKSWMGLGTLGNVTVEQIADFDGDGRDDLRIRTANGDLGAELVKGEDQLTWAYYGSVGAEWLTEPLGLK